MNALVIILLIIFFVIYFCYGSWKKKKVAELTGEVETHLKGKGFKISEKITIPDIGWFYYAVRPHSGIWFDYDNKQFFVRPFEKYVAGNHMQIYKFKDIMDFEVTWTDLKEIKRGAFMTSGQRLMSDLQLRIGVRVGTYKHDVLLRPFYGSKFHPRVTKKAKEALENMAATINRVSTINCPSCGKLAPNGAAFCNDCGAKID